MRGCRIAALVFGFYVLGTLEAIAGRDQYFGMDPKEFAALGAEYLSRDEVRQELAGRSEIFPNGDKAYYASNGELFLKKKSGEAFAGHWKVVGVGRMCTTFNGKQDYCHGYMRFKSRVYYVWTGKVWSVRVVKSGRAF